MLLYCIILFLGLALLSYSTRPIRSSHFIVTPGKIYLPSSALSLLTNLSSITTVDCATACLNYNPCQTAAFYNDRNICSLFDEPSSLGTTPSQSGALLLAMDPPSEHLHLSFSCIIHSFLSSSMPQQFHQYHLTESVQCFDQQLYTLFVFVQDMCYISHHHVCLSA